MKEGPPKTPSMAELRAELGRLSRMLEEVGDDYERQKPLQDAISTTWAKILALKNRAKVALPTTQDEGAPVPEISDKEFEEWVIATNALNAPPDTFSPEIEKRLDELRGE